MSTVTQPTITEAFNRLEKAAAAWDTGDQELMQEYDRQIQSYDADVNKCGWRGPFYTAKAVERYIPNKIAHLLDVCGGTGAVAKLLLDRGYNNIDYLDGSVEMARAAMKNGYYNIYIRQIIPEDEHTIIRSDTYDATMISGGHITEGKIREMLRIIKPGGFFIAAIVETTEVDEKEAKKVMEFFDQLAIEQVCHTMETTKVDSMILRDDGSAAPGHVMVLQRN